MDKKIGHLRTTRKDKNGNIRYQMIIEVWRNGKKFYTSETFDNEEEARKWGKLKHDAIKEGKTTKEALKKRRLSHAIRKYIEEMLPHKPKNAKNVEQHLTWWNKRLGKCFLNEIAPIEIKECCDKLQKETTHQGKQRAPATVVRYISSLSSVFEAAIKEWYWIEKNPVRLIPKPTISNALTRFLEVDECKRLLASCKESRNPYLYPIVILALSTGMRRGELLGLKWEDIDFGKKLIILRQTKNGTSRYVPMISIASQILQSLYEKETMLDASYHVFPPLNLSRYLDIRTAWKFALKRAKISGGFTFHTLRHSCASFLAMSGATQRDIGAILGHKDLRSTLRYSHLSQGHLSEALEKAAEKFIGKDL